MLEPFLVGLALSLCFVGSFTDLKTREVPDWLNYAGITSGVMIHIIGAVMLWNFWFLLESLLGLGIAFIIGAAMYYTGQWGGGDSKLLMALGTLVGFYPSFDNMFVSFLFWTIITGTVYGLAWSFVLMIKNWTRFLAAFKQVTHTPHALFVRKGAYIFVAIGIVTVSWVNDSVFQLLPCFTFFGIPIYALLIASMKAIEHTCMIKTVNPSVVTEGDWIAKAVVVDGKYITGPKELGITKKQLTLLRTYAQKKKIKQVIIKVGIPFVPSFLLGLVAAVVWNNPLVFFL